MLCRIFQKSGLGPPNGDRYAPFVEEEWDDDAALLVPGGEAEEDVDARAGENELEQVYSLHDICMCMIVFILYREITSFPRYSHCILYI